MSLRVDGSAGSRLRMDLRGYRISQLGSRAGLRRVVGRHVLLSWAGRGLVRFAVAVARVVMRHQAVLVARALFSPSRRFLVGLHCGCCCRCC